MRRYLGLVRGLGVFTGLRRFPLQYFNTATSPLLLLLRGKRHYYFEDPILEASPPLRWFDSIRQWNCPIEIAITAFTPLVPVLGIRKFLLPFTLNDKSLISNFHMNTVYSLLNVGY